MKVHYKESKYGLTIVITRSEEPLLAITTLYARSPILCLWFASPNNLITFSVNSELLETIIKASFSKSKSQSKTENPVKFYETFFFQFINPKGVMAAITLISKFVSQENYISSSISVIVVCSVTAFLSITSWALLGKFLRKFATNNEFIKRFNYAMSILLVGCVASFYI